jgi:hypothetical protein
MSSQAKSSIEFDEAIDILYEVLQFPVDRATIFRPNNPSLLLHNVQLVLDSLHDQFGGLLPSFDQIDQIIREGAVLDELPEFMREAIWLHKSFNDLDGKKIRLKVIDGGQPEIRIPRYLLTKIVDVMLWHALRSARREILVISEIERSSVRATGLTVRVTSDLIGGPSATDRMTGQRSASLPSWNLTSDLKFTRILVKSFLHGRFSLVRAADGRVRAKCFLPLPD